MPYTSAYIALFCWPVVVFFLFRALPRAKALIASILGGYLLLPEGVGINPPMLPTIDKTLIPALSAFAICHLSSERQGRRRVANADYESTRPVNNTYRINLDKKESASDERRFTNARPATENIKDKAVSSKIEYILLFIIIITPFITVIQNSESYISGPRIIGGLKIYDAFSFLLTSIVSLIPYLLARRYLSQESEQAMLLYSIGIAGLLYSMPALFEIRMSPQLSNWIYGFLNQPFAQTRRGDSFRPVVFLHHGLWLAIFMAMSTIAAFSAWRVRRRLAWFLGGLWLLGTLLMSSSLGALALAIVFLPIAIMLSVRTQMLIAASAALIIVTYPLLRGVDLIPVDAVTNVARTISEGRAQSFAFRVENEDALLDHANTKPLAGWGGYGRNRVFDEYTGREISVTDGWWIITVGTSGWLGYVANYGLLTLPVFLLFIRRRKINTGFATSGLCLILMVNLVDTMLNATITPLTWLIAGALAGRSRFMASSHHES